ncbi:MAG: DNA-binding response regulator [Bacteroidetes bacterium]|nr:DNA-binding response regulator [Bacteroidota bacterium]
MNEPKTLQDILTQRETEILILIAQGLGSKQIAAQLEISENTVANHRKNMLSKAQASSSAELIYLYNNNYYIKNSH